MYGVALLQELVRDSHSAALRAWAAAAPAVQTAVSDALSAAIVSPTDGKRLLPRLKSPLYPCSSVLANLTIAHPCPIAMRKIMCIMAACFTSVMQRGLFWSGRGWIDS